MRDGTEPSLGVGGRVKVGRCFCQDARDLEIMADGKRKLQTNRLFSLEKKQETYKCSLLTF